MTNTDWGYKDNYLFLALSPFLEFKFAGLLDTGGFLTEFAQDFVNKR